MAQSTVLNFGRDAQGYNAYAPATANDKWSATITNGSETHITIPSTHQTWIAAFSYQPGTNVWVDLTGGTAIIPVGATLAVTTSELNPGQRLVQAGGKISMITDNTSADVGVALYAVSYP
jgi:hypothetical protein